MLIILTAINKLQYIFCHISEYHFGPTSIFDLYIYFKSIINNRYY